jgi:predicted dehydrogenase
MSSQGAYDTEDNFTCTVTFPTGVAMARLTWNAAVRKVIYTIHGDNGAIRLEDDDIEITERGKPAHESKVERRSIASHWGDASHKEWFGAILDRFNTAIEAHELVGADARDAVLCVKLIETAYASSRSGCVEMSLSPGVHVANAVP